MWPSGRGFPRHVLGLGIVTFIIPAAAPLSYMWEPVQTLSGPEAILDVLKRVERTRPFLFGLSLPSTIVMSPIAFYSFCFGFGDVEIDRDNSALCPPQWEAFQLGAFLL